MSVDAILRTAAIGILSIALVACERDATFEPRAAVSYIPFGIATAVPVTRENIEAMAFRFGTPPQKRSDFQELVRRLSVGPACPFNERLVRAEIVLPDSRDVVFIDDNGCVDGSRAVGVGTHKASPDRIRFHLWNMTQCLLGEDACAGTGP